MRPPDPLTLAAIVALFSVRPLLGLLERQREAPSMARRLARLALMFVLAIYVVCQLAVTPGEIGFVMDDCLRIGLVTVLGMAVMIAADVLGARLLHASPQLLRTRTQILGAWLNGAAHGPLVVYIIFAAIYEETVFRGLGLALAAGVGVPMVAAVLGLAILFGFQHSAAGWAGIAYATGFGVTYSLLYLAAGSLLAPMVVHAAGNAYTLLWTYPRLLRSSHERAAPAFLF